ncbi:hypothetical protein SAMN04489730_1938 [Amycolatopsis australiensis]|uniref:Uncharacterized protein n=1 Tax=Amycolatopsis australiensis TaxID=546364 RepID=A0A1K1QKQ1_9PSEU|nr:hypothetical protein SAMN04489730_1938 [Amycolatopsis australiensis]
MQASSGLGHARLAPGRVGTRLRAHRTRPGGAASGPVGRGRCSIHAGSGSGHTGLGRVARLPVRSGEAGARSTRVPASRTGLGRVARVSGSGRARPVPSPREFRLPHSTARPSCAGSGSGHGRSCPSTPVPASRTPDSAGWREAGTQHARVPASLTPARAGSLNSGLPHADQGGIMSSGRCRPTRPLDARPAAGRSPAPQIGVQRPGDEPPQSVRAGLTSSSASSARGCGIAASLARYARAWISYSSW